MLPVSQAVQASKATVLRTPAASEVPADQGFAALFSQGLKSPGAPAPEPARQDSAATASQSGAASQATADQTRDAAAAHGKAALRQPDAGEPPPPSSARPASSGKSGTDAVSGSSAAPDRPRRSADSGSTTDPALTAGAGAAAAAAAAAAAGAAAAGGATQATAAGSTDRSAAAPLGRARLDELQGLAGDGSPAAGAADADADAGPDGAFATALGKLAAGAHGPGSGGDMRDGAAFGAATDAGSGQGNVGLGAALNAMLARQGNTVAVPDLNAGLGHAGQGGRSVSEAAGAADPSQLYAQVSQSALQNLSQEQAAQTLQGASLPVSPPLGDERWSAALGQQALFMARNQLSSAQLTVNPPNLGPIQITLDLKHDQANAVFVSPHDAVRQAIEASLPQLRDMFSAAGLHLSTAQVSADAGSSAWSSGGSHAGSGTGRSSGRPGSTPEALAVSALGSTPVRISRGLLDTFA